ncbi:dockerin type I repeat-containing protein [Porcipelethomonas sp.]|uniref:dockerin type I repeat-containing protein n=1 Tax=Porcipelethomonas sp. TaxID=2981675 RepID=UPI003EF38BC9
MKTLTKRFIPVILTIAVFSILISGNSVYYDFPEAYISAETAAEQSGNYTLGISDTEGNPGDKVTVDVIFSGDCNLDSIDAVMKWEDSDLKADKVTGVSEIGISSVIGSNYITFAGFSSDLSGASSGSIVSVDFTIPENAQPGTIYDLTFKAVNVLGTVDGDGNTLNILNNADITAGKITVKGADTDTVPHVSLSDIEGKPGETVTVDVLYDCKYNFDAIDAAIKWNDTNLKSESVSGAENVNATYLNGSGYVTLAGYTSVTGGISSGKIASIDFVIPDDAQPGTVYNLTFTVVSTVSVYNEDGVQTDMSQKAVMNRGTIKVSEGAVTTAVTSATKPIATTVTTVNTTVSKTTDVSETSDTAAVTSATKQVTVTTAESTFASSSTLASTSVSAAETTVTTPVSTTETIKGDADLDGKLSVRDATVIAQKLAQNKKEELPERADFNGDNVINVRDAAAIARYLANEYKNSK